MPPSWWWDPLLPLPADGAGATPVQMPWVQLPVMMPFILSGFLLGNTARESCGSEVEGVGGRRRATNTAGLGQTLSNLGSNLLS